MLAKVFIYATLFAASAFGSAVPTPADSGLVAVEMATDPIEAAHRRGIDVYGPIPTDAQKIEGGYLFDDNSDASYWARAQVLIASSPDLVKRQTDVIGIGMWTQNLCTGQGVWFDNVRYAVQYFSTTNMFSVGIAYRGMRSNERLDFSRARGSDFCGEYRYSAGLNTPAGCFNSQQINCFHFHL